MPLSSNLLSISDGFHFAEPVSLEKAGIMPENANPVAEFSVFNKHKTDKKEPCMKGRKMGQILKMESDFQHIVAKITKC